MSFLATLIGAALSVNAVPLYIQIPFTALEAPSLSVQQALAAEIPPPIEEATTTSIMAISEDPIICGCVTYLREKLSVNIRGDAKDLSPNTGLIAPGIVILLQYKGIAHAGLIVKKEGSIVTFRDTNRVASCTPGWGTIDLRDPTQTKNVRGFYDPSLVKPSVPQSLVRG